MYQFFVEPSQIEGDRITIRGKDVNHMKNVLRMKTGEEISVSNGADGREYRCGIVEFAEEEVICELRFIREEETELASKVYLFQGLPKADKMELIIQKAVELGVYEIIPVVSKRTVIKLDAKKADHRIKRWQAIAEAAAKQSRRRIIPQVRGVMNFREAVDYAGQAQVKLIPYELAEGMDQTRRIMEGLKPGEDIAIFIGPEGGFAQEEISGAKEKGILPITLGKRILRTETAGMTVLSIIMYHLEGESYSNSRMDE